MTDRADDPAPAADSPAAALTTPELLAGVLRRYRRAMAAALRAGDYSAVPPAATWLLIALAREPGNVGELAERLGIAKQAASRMADRLAALGYCERVRSEANRREVLLRATEEGRGAAAVLLAAVARADAEVLAPLGAEGRAQFARGLGVLDGRGAPGGGTED